MLIRSGLSILVDHPRLYFNDDCTPGSEWIRFTPLKVPRDRIWTAKDDARYISPLVAHARIPAHDRHCAGLAFHQCPRLHHHGRFLRHHALQYRAVEASCSPRRRWCSCRHGTPGYTMRRSTCRRSRTVLRLQRAAADCVFLGRLRIWPAGHSDWHRHVARRGESLSVVCEDLRRQAGGAFDSLPYDAQFSGVSRGARDFDRDDRLCAQHESHRVGHRRSKPSGHVSGLVRHRPGCPFLGRGALYLVASSARVAACAQVRGISDATAYA